jgi:hypothetical protein
VDEFRIRELVMEFVALPVADRGSADALCVNKSDKETVWDDDAGSRLTLAVTVDECLRFRL